MGYVEEMKKDKDILCEECGHPKPLDLENDLECRYWVCDECSYASECVQEIWEERHERKTRRERFNN
jgi:DNA-directed RNA polymerase subunit RPC12/RpoP